MVYKHEYEFAKVNMLQDRYVFRINSRCDIDSISVFLERNRFVICVG